MAVESDRSRQRIHLPAFFAGVITGLAAISLGSLALAYGSTHPVRRRLQGDPGDIDLEFENVQFRSRDGLLLSGWFIPDGRPRGVVVLCHGFPNNRSELMPWVEMLRGTGFSMLLFDFRALGKSEGNLSTIGLQEVEDVLGAIDYLSFRTDTRKLAVGVFGLSMGAAASLMAAANDLRIQAVAAHASYASLDRAIDQRFKLFFGPGGRTMSFLTGRWGKRWLKTDPREISPLRIISDIAPRPVLILHGGRDFLTRPDDARLLHKQAGASAELRIFPRSFHSFIHASDRNEYRSALRDFFERNLSTVR